MGIKIISKRDGFRRCGIPHSSSPTVYPDDRFTKEELVRLKDEPMLIVVDVEDKPDSEEEPEDKEKDNEGKENPDDEEPPKKPEPAAPRVLQEGLPPLGQKFGKQNKETPGGKSKDFSEMSYAELRVLAKAKGVNAFGTRKALIARIKKGK